MWRLFVVFTEGDEVCVLSSRYLRPKRGSIIKMNLCGCLLLFYFGFMLALQQENPDVLSSNESMRKYNSDLCLAGE